MPDKVFGMVKLLIEGPDPQTGKPFLRLDFPGGPSICITTNIGEMIGGAAKGARERLEAELEQRHRNN